MPLWKRELRPGGQDIPMEQWRQPMPPVAYKIKEWMWGLKEDVPKVEVRNGEVINHRPEQRNALSQHAGQGSRLHRWEGRPQFPRDTSGGSPSSGGWSSDWWSDQSSQQLTMMRVSRKPTSVGRKGLRVKVNLPFFKHKKTKDAVTYHSWQWGVAIVCHSDWEWTAFPAICLLVIGEFPRDLARGLGENATLSDVLQMLDKHYGVVMTFNTLSKKLYSLKQGSGENVAKFGMCLSQQVQILQLEYPGRIQLEHIEEIKGDCFYRGLNSEYS